MKMKKEFGTMILNAIVKTKYSDGSELYIVHFWKRKNGPGDLKICKDLEEVTNFLRGARF